MTKIKWTFAAYAITMLFSYAANADLAGECAKAVGASNIDLVQDCVTMINANCTGNSRTATCQNAFLNEMRSGGMVERADQQGREVPPPARTAQPGGAQPQGAAAQQQVAARGDYSSIQQCADMSSDAKAFCTDPIAFSSDNEVKIGSRENAQMVGNLVMLGGVMSASSSNGGDRKLCSLMQGGGTAVLGLNATFATRCTAFINDCETKCAEASTTAGTVQGSIHVRVGKVDKVLTGSVDASSFVDGQIRVCNSQRNKAAEMTSSAGQSFMAMQMGRLCKEAADANTSLAATMAPPEMPVVGTDCVTNPSDPMCGNNGTGGVGSGSNSTYTDSTSGAMDGKGTDDFNVAADALTDTQQAGVPGGGAGEGSKNSGVANGGGQMLGGGGQGGIGGGGDEKGGRGQGGGYKTDILQGERAGGGYNVAQGGGFASGSGWSGYGNNGTQERGSGLDLRKFLPGQQNVPVRGPAGLNRVNAEVAPMHEDIFKKISVRVLVVCRTNRLKDCK
ncbi:MAG: hypothetical protein AB7N80_15295 [Bdellovibrionales bacterium]